MQPRAPSAARLVALTIAVTPSAIVDLRRWVACYASANGRQCLGTFGVNQGSSYRCSATRRRVAAWMAPTVALNPWNLDPAPRPGCSAHPQRLRYSG